ncbi:phage portal protein, PBSX family [Burkholderia sp. OK233]|nr:phage portal protein, PBSX family [Burkholderia sp. OK233]
MALVRERYADFGPTLACEKLVECHGIRLARETVRRLMMDAGLWVPRRQRPPKIHQLRSRRACVGELVQIDGSDHRWFEQRAPACTLLVYVDDATSRLMALHAAWLNESATLFRWRYHENGSHAGFILYMTDAAQKQEDADALREALKNSKGPGNFRNLFMYAPNGKKEGIQLIPVSEVTAKDEFFNIKNVTRDDLLAAHRVPPQLIGVVPSNTGGFGAADTAAEVFGANEIEPLQRRFTQLNEWIGDEVVRFNPYSIKRAAVAA